MPADRTLVKEGPSNPSSTPSKDEPSVLVPTLSSVVLSVVIESSVLTGTLVLLGGAGGRVADGVV